MPLTRYKNKSRYNIKFKHYNPLQLWSSLKGIVTQLATTHIFNFRHKMRTKNSKTELKNILLLSTFFFGINFIQFIFPIQRPVE